MTRYESVTDALGGTPLIRLTRSAAGLRPRIYVKVEANNPGGSVKDRAALWMLRQAEADGLLRPGGTVVETTSGNTGIGLALYAAHLGYRTVIFTSSQVSREKRSLLAAYGAEVRLVDAFVPKSHPDSLRSVAERFTAQTPGAWLAGQYDNPANAQAHEATTGPEIWADTEGAVTHLVATVGTGGTITGTGRYLKSASAGRVQVIGAEPVTSAYSGGDGSPKYIEGAGHFVHPDATEDSWPGNLSTDGIDRFIRVSDGAAIEAIRRVARTEGILAGGSAGVALVAAFTLAEELTERDTVVAILPDSGRFYLSTYFDDEWLRSRGFDASPALKPAKTLTATGAVRHDVPSVSRDSTVRDAVTRLAVQGTAPDAPVLVVYDRQRTESPHPSEVSGWTTLRRLAAAPQHHKLVSELAQAVPGRVGAGMDASEAFDRLEKAGRWQIALVLDDGRVRGVIERDSLRAAAGTRAGGAVLPRWEADGGGTRIEMAAWNDPRAVSLRNAMDEELRPRYADRHAKGFQMPAGMAVDPADLIVTLIAVTADGQPAGHAALRRLGGQAEVKRVFVTKESRGSGLSVRLMLALEDLARDNGIPELILQTGDRQPEAERLYEKLKYRRIPIYPPYEALTHSNCFAKGL